MFVVVCCSLFVVRCLLFVDRSRCVVFVVRVVVWCWLFVMFFFCRVLHVVFCSLSFVMCRLLVSYDVSFLVVRRVLFVVSCF